ncbi:MAG TPA: hypothetical protein VGM59_13460 [Dongiaceae bacterium]
MNVLLGCIVLCLILQGCSAGLRDGPAGSEEDDQMTDGPAANPLQASHEIRDRFLDWEKTA